MQEIIPADAAAVAFTLIGEADVAENCGGTMR
jgi:hypothetical protein